MIGNLIDNVTRAAETAVDGVNEALFEPVIRLGVTGLSRSGKTVFITSLVANLLERGRMPQLTAAKTGRITAAYLQPQPDDTVPRFDYENHLAAMTGSKPNWPDGTRSISQLRVSLRVEPSGIMGGLRGARTVHLDITDYPGEWLLDLPLLQQSYSDWSATALGTARSPARADLAANWLAELDGIDPNADLDEPAAAGLAQSFTDYLSASRAAGFSACAPGRFLMPGDLDGSPALTFAPLPDIRSKRGSIHRAFERRYNAYKSRVVTPFFRDHFSRLDRQVVLVDALGAVHAGPRAVADLQTAMADVLRCFRVGRNGLLAGLFGKKIERILFAATKADHLHHSQHGALTNIVDALVRDAKSRIEFRGAETAAMSIASLRTTTEETIKHDGEDLDCVRGTLLDTGKQVAMFAGDLPNDPNVILRPAAEGAANWLNDDYAVMNFAPAPNTAKAGSGPPHIRLDRAAEFIIGDRLS